MWESFSTWLWLINRTKPHVKLLYFYIIMTRLENDYIIILRIYYNATFTIFYNQIMILLCCLLLNYLYKLFQHICKILWFIIQKIYEVMNAKYTFPQHICNFLLKFIFHDYQLITAKYTLSQHICKILWFIVQKIYEL